jgi:uncharacterized protein (TIGR00369 family)
MMKIMTHEQIDTKLCGIPVIVEQGFSQVKMNAEETMAVDPSGLIHGGFIFGLADHAAMIAVNHPNVVLGSADVKFLKPVKTGEKVVATATVNLKDGKKQNVSVTVSRGNDPVFQGEFTCFVLNEHVLSA